MAISSASHPYAKALFLSVEEKGKMDIVSGDMKALLELVEKDENFQDLIQNPTLSSQDKKMIIDKVSQSKVDALTLDFLHLLIQKNRLDILPDIARNFISLCNEALDLVEVEVTTAVEMPDDVLNQIVKKYMSDKKFEMKSHVNPDIIGGYIVEYNNKIVDNSIQNKLNKFKIELEK